MDVVIEFDKVSKSFPLYHHIGSGIKDLLLHPRRALSLLRGKQYLAIEDISFRIYKGEAVALIGGNGAGKSTSLSLLTGVIKPTTGRITVHGRIASMLELGGGFHPELTGRENILLNATLTGLRRKEILQKMPDIIAFSELGDFIDEPIRVYSSGMMARLGFSVISQVDPDILIIDEVLAVGDVAFQQKCLATINAFKRKGVTILFVSHNMHDVQEVCDKVIWIENHRLREIGQPDEITRKYHQLMLEKHQQSSG